MHNIAVLPGDGIGVDVTSVVLNCLSLLSKKYSIDYQTKTFSLGTAHYLKTGEVLSEKTLQKLGTHDVIFLGAIGSPSVAPGILEKGLLLKIRFAFDQYINLRPIKLYPCAQTPVVGKVEEDIDFVVVRENTGGLYTGVGGKTMEGTPHEIAVQSMLYSHKQVERCLRYAFELARSRSRRLLTLVGKSNVLTHVFDLWTRVFENLSSEFPDVRTDYCHVDAACVHMINDPKRFDVIVTNNMFGDIITDLGAVLQGGMGMASSANLNPERQYPSMFEPVHGSAPDIAGQNKANPIAALLSLKLMLDFLKEFEASKALENIFLSLKRRDWTKMSTTDIAHLFLKELSS